MDYMITTRHLTKNIRILFRSTMSRSISGKGQFMDFSGQTAPGNLEIIRRILGLSERAVDDALELVGLEEFGNRLAKKYSLGMKQRLGLAGALLGRPPILIFDVNWGKGSDVFPELKTFHSPKLNINLRKTEV